MTYLEPQILRVFCMLSVVHWKLLTLFHWSKSKGIILVITFFFSATDLKRQKTSSSSLPSKKYPSWKKMKFIRFLDIEARLNSVDIDWPNSHLPAQVFFVMHVVHCTEEQKSINDLILFFLANAEFNRWVTKTQVIKSKIEHVNQYYL